MFKKASSGPPPDRPVFIAGSGRCGSTLLQSILNTNPDFLIWGEHNGFLRQVAAAYFEAAHPRFPDREPLGETKRVNRLRDARRWPAWDNLRDEAGFRESFRNFVRSFFADPTNQASRWGFKEIRYPRDSEDRTWQFLFDCFPEARLVVSVREPRATIFSMLSHWVFSERPHEEIGNAELDQQILAVASPGTRNMPCCINSLSSILRAARRFAMKTLGFPKPAGRWQTFLKPIRSISRAEMGKVKDAADKTGPTALRIQQRMHVIEPQIESVTAEMGAVHGYHGYPSVGHATLKLP